MFEKERILSITPEELCISFGGQQSCHAWDEVEQVGRDREHIYIILKGVLHHVIPLSAFTDEKEADDFFTTLDGYQSAI